MSIRNNEDNCNSRDGEDFETRLFGNMGTLPPSHTSQVRFDNFLSSIVLVFTEKFQPSNFLFRLTGTLYGLKKFFYQVYFYLLGLELFLLEQCKYCKKFLTVKSTDWWFKLSSKDMDKLVVVAGCNSLQTQIFSGFFLANKVLFGPTRLLKFR